MFRSLAVRAAQAALLAVFAAVLIAQSSGPRVLPPTPADPNAPPASVVTFRAPTPRTARTQRTGPRRPGQRVRGRPHLGRQSPRDECGLPADAQPSGHRDHQVQSGRASRLGDLPRRQRRPQCVAPVLGRHTTGHRRGPTGQRVSRWLDGVDGLPDGQRGHSAGPGPRRIRRLHHEAQPGWQSPRLLDLLRRAGWGLVRASRRARACG